ncbi:MAG: hypothetical protein ACR2O6_02490 [Ilumatobacteraceae bacterium]
MNRRGAVLAALLLGVAAMAWLLGASGSADAASPPDPPPPSVPVTVNDFVGEREDFFDECVGTSVQRPDCGSKGRGGWRQAAVFVAVVAGVGIVAWRVTVGVRRGRADPPPAGAG